jgi:hypothetical protein
MNERSESSETYALPNGNLRRTQHTVPVRVKREGRWTPIDTTLAAVAGRISPKAAAGKVTFSAGGSAPLVTITDQGRSVSLSWPKPLPAPVLDGPTATYSEVLPGVDLAVAANVDGFSQALIVKTAEAAANPELATIDFGLKTEGLTLKQDAAAGSLTAVNEAGQTLFATSTARMWDSSGKDEAAPGGQARSAVVSTSDTPTDLTPGTNSSNVDVEFTHNQLTLTPDQKLLNSPTTTYPVYIDPRVTGLRQAWTIAYKPHPNDSYWNGTGWSGGTTSEARVGYESSTGGTARSIFSMDSKFLARVKVIDAQFQITETHSWSCTAKPVEIYLTSPISSATTWNKQPTWGTRQDTRSFAHGNESFGCPDKAVDFTVKEATTRAAAGSWSAIVFGLRAPQSAEDGKDAYSWKKFKSDAKLIVEFNRLPKNPWALDTIPSTKVNSTECGNGATYTTVGNTDVTLNAQVWDQDGGDVNVEFLVWPTGKYAGSPGIIFSQRVRKTVIASDSKGVRASIVVPKTLLAQYKDVSAGQFSWKAQAEDVGDSTFASDWTPTAGASGCRFGFDPTAPSTMPTVTSVNGLYPENQDGALARTEGQFILGAGGEKDVAEYRWALDRTPPHNIVKPATAGANVTIKLTPLTPGPHTLFVQTFDAGKNPGPTYPYRFDVTSPGITDKPGDVNGDALPDMFAIDGKNNLRLYSGTGAGALDVTIPVEEDGSWEGALLTHRGSWDENFTEDLVARKSDGNLWFYPNDGIGGFTKNTMEEVFFFTDPHTGLSLDPATLKQIVSVGDLTPNEGASNPDFIGVIDDQLWFLPGYSAGNIQVGYPIGNAGWSNMQLGSPGDVDGDGFTDLIARNKGNGEVWLYRGKSNGDTDGDGVPDGGTDPSSLGISANRSAYATGWTTTARPLITATGDSNGDGIGDLWTTTANTAAGLEFFPGRKTGLLGAPTVVGTGGWQAIKGIS